MTLHRKVTIEEIEKGLDTVALLIKQYGDIYWPIFERLERELDERKSRASRLDKRLEARSYRCSSRTRKGKLNK